MKVQKIISLDPQTAKIAGRIKNFSAWVRMSLYAFDQEIDVASEVERRMRWSQACRMVATALIEQSKATDPEFNGDVDTIIAKAMNQTTLEEFQ